MYKLTFDFERQTIGVETDSQKAIITDGTLHTKKKEILAAAGLESLDAESIHSETTEFLSNPHYVRCQAIEKRETAKKQESVMVAIKRVGEDVELLNVVATYRQDLAQYVITQKTGMDVMENVYLNNDNTLVMLSDKEGPLKNYDINILLETSSTKYPIQELVGSLVFARINKSGMLAYPYANELESLRPEDVRVIRQIVDRGIYLRYVLGK